LIDGAFGVPFRALPLPLPTPRQHRRRCQYTSPHSGTCLYIGNIDKRLTEDQLRDAFEAHGEIDYCFIVYEPHSGPGSAREPKQSRGYGFAKYKNDGEAERAKEKMQGVELNGRKITVEVSKRTKPREPTPGTNVLSRGGI
jgi:RNA recognition motif-containing protein